MVLLGWQGTASMVHGGAAGGGGTLSQGEHAEILRWEMEGEYSTVALSLSQSVCVL